MTRASAQPAHRLLNRLTPSATVFRSILRSRSALALSRSSPNLIPLIRPPYRSRTMTGSASAFDGVALLSQLPALPSLPEADPTHNPLDVFRLAIASQLTEILPEVKLEDVFPGVHVPLRGADFIVAMPRFRIPGFKPNELAEKVVKEVSHFMSFGLFMMARSPTSFLVQTKCLYRKCGSKRTYSELHRRYQHLDQPHIKDYRRFKPC